MNAILYGVMLVQMVIYYQRYKKDATWMRIFVLFLFIVETLNTILDFGIIYEPLVSQYGSRHATTFFPLLLPSDPLLTVIISTPIQIFIAYRIKVISRATWLAACICTLAMASFSGGVWLTVTVIRVRLYSKKPELHWPALLWLLASAIADIIITISLAWNLARRRTGFSGTDDAINKIIRLTIQTGFITAVFATLDVVCFLALPHSTMNFIWDFALSKLYTNALLSTLNARSGWANAANVATGNNVLFGEDDPTPQIESFSTLNFRTSAIMSTATAEYELETTVLDTYKNRNGRNFSLSMTKEVSTVADLSARPYHSAL